MDMQQRSRAGPSDSTQQSREARLPFSPRSRISSSRGSRATITGLSLGSKWAKCLISLLTPQPYPHFDTKEQEQPKAER
jgi:hypothetical protein